MVRVNCQGRLEIRYRLDKATKYDWTTNQRATTKHEPGSIAISTEGAVGIVLLSHPTACNIDTFIIKAWDISLHHIPRSSIPFQFLAIEP